MHIFYFLVVSCAIVKDQLCVDPEAADFLHTSLALEVGQGAAFKNNGCKTFLTYIPVIRQRRVGSQHVSSLIKQKETNTSAKFCEIHDEPCQTMIALKHGSPQLVKNLSRNRGSAPISRGLQRSIIAGGGLRNFLLPKDHHRCKVEFGCHGEEGKSCSRGLLQTEAGPGQERTYCLPVPTTSLAPDESNFSLSQRRDKAWRKTPFCEQALQDSSELLEEE